jgi:hypothetical protein
MDKLVVVIDDHRTVLQAMDGCFEVGDTASLLPSREQKHWTFFQGSVVPI